MATTAGATTDVEQDPAAASPILPNTRQIILDDAGGGTALDGNGGLVKLTPGAAGIEALIGSPADKLVTSKGFTVPTNNTLAVVLNFAPNGSTSLTIIDNTTSPPAPISGTFSTAADGTIAATYNGQSYRFTPSYTGNSKDDLVLTRAAMTTIGLVDPSDKFYLQNSNAALTSGTADTSFTYQSVSGTSLEPIIGDWTNNDGYTGGLYDPSTFTFYLQNSNDPGAAGIQFQWAPAGVTSAWLPLAGDWNNDGKTEVGLYDPATSIFHLASADVFTATSNTFTYGSPVYFRGGVMTTTPIHWQLLVGRWNGNGPDTVGLYDPAESKFYLKNDNTTGYGNITFLYGSPVYVGGPHASTAINWQAVAGNWTGDPSGKDTVGLYDPGESKFYLRNSNTSGPADNAFAYLPAGTASTLSTYAGFRAVAGRWLSDATAPQPLLTAVGSVANVTPLTNGQLQPIVNEAIARWTAAGLPASTVTKLRTSISCLALRTVRVMPSSTGNWPRRQTTRSPSIRRRPATAGLSIPRRRWMRSSRPRRPAAMR